MEEHKKDPPPLQGRTGEPRGLTGERAGRTWQQPPRAPQWLQSPILSPLASEERDGCQATAPTRRERAWTRTPLKITRVGEDVMANTATTPPASPTDTIIPAATSGQDNVGKKSPQPADKPKTAPTVQKTNPAPKPRPGKPGKPDQQFRSQPDGNPRFGGGWARFDKLGPWHRSQLLCNALGAVRSIRPLLSEMWLIGCATEAQQSKLARLDKLPGGIPIEPGFHDPWSREYWGPSPWVATSWNSSGKIWKRGSSDSTTSSRSPLLPSRSPWKQRSCPVRYGSVPHRSRCRLSPHRWDGAPNVRPLTLQAAVLREADPLLQVRERLALTEQCDAQVFSCVSTAPPSRAVPKCKRSKTYIPYNVAMQRARHEMKPKAPPPAQPASAAVDNCWSRDRTAPSSLSADTGTPVS